MAENNIDPTISLGVKTPEQASPLSGINSLLPFASVGANLANVGSEVQTRNIANAQALRGMLGQNALAEAARASIDPATGQLDFNKYSNLAMTNPLSAGVAAAQMASVRQMQLAQLQATEVRQKMIHSAMGDIFTSVAANARTPNNIPRAISTQLAAQPDLVREAIGPAVSQYFGDTLTSDLPDDPTEAANTIKQRVMPLAVQFLGKDANELINGRPETIDSGDALHMGMRDLFTGQFRETAVQPKGLPPQLAEPTKTLFGGVNRGSPASDGRIPISVGGVPPAPFAAPGATPTTQLQLMPGSGGGAAVQPSAPPAASTPLQPNSAPAAMTWTGKPLDAGLTHDPSIIPGKFDISGSPLLYQQNAAEPANEDLAKGLTEVGPLGKGFKDATSVVQQLTNMRSALGTLGAKGFLAPGALGQYRNEFAKAVNSFAGVFDDPWLASLGFDASKVGAGEDIIKTTTPMAISALTTMLGNQREAALTIQNMMKAVPGLDNSPFGAQLLTNVVESASRRVIDQYNFTRDWGVANKGIYLGAQKAFNDANPPEDYAQTALNRMGIDPATGKFQSPVAIHHALDQHWITPEQAIAIAKLQFPNAHQQPVP